MIGRSPVFGSHLFGGAGGMNSPGDRTEMQPEGGDEVLDQAASPDGFCASMWKGLAAVKVRLHESTSGCLMMQTSNDLNSNYYFTWLKTLAEEDVLEDSPDDGWGETIAERPEEMLGVFGGCSTGTRAREATASFYWKEVDTSTADRRTRQRDASSSSNPSVPVLDTEIVARTGAFVVFEHEGVHVRGLALWFMLYLPPKGTGTPLMVEFQNQVVLLAYVYVAVLQRNCLVVCVRQHQHVSCPPRLTNHSSPHRLCTRARTRCWRASHTGSCATTASSASGTIMSTRACRLK